MEKIFLKIILGKLFPQLCHGNYFPLVNEEIIFRNIYRKLVSVHTMEIDFRQYIAENLFISHIPGLHFLEAEENHFPNMMEFHFLSS